MDAPTLTGDFLYEACDLVSPNTATLAVLMLSLGSFALTAWVLSRPHSHRRAGRRRTDSVASDVPSSPGPVTLTGTVAYAEDATVAVRLDVTQEGEEEESSGQWTQVWTEVDRRVTVAPFYLVTESGQRVRVEPTREVLFIDSFTKKVLVHRTSRVRTAELEPGERVWVEGALVAVSDPGKPDGYRGVGSTLVMRDSSDHRMRISSQPLDAPHERQAEFWRKIGFGYLVASVVLQGSFVPYYLRAAIGETVDAVVVGRHVVDGGDSADEYVVDFAMADETKASISVEREYHSAFVADARVEVRKVKGVPWFTQLGPAPSVGGFHLFLPTVVLGGALIGTLVRRLNGGSEDEARLVDREDGRLQSGTDEQ